MTSLRIPKVRMSALERKSIIWISVIALATTSMVLTNLAGMGSLSVASKMTASSAFVALALTGGALTIRYGQVVLIALVLSWAGDLLLAGQ